MKRILTVLLLTLLTGPLLAQVGISANAYSGCSPLPVVISVDTPDPAAITTYAWSVTFPNGNIVNSSNSEYVGVFSQAGTYDVTITINGNLTTTEIDFITVNAPPVAAISVDNPEGCIPHCVQFSDASTEGGGAIAEWSWDFGNGNLSNQQNPDYCYETPGFFTPVLSVQDENGCFNSVSAPQLIYVSNDPPIVDFQPSTLNDCNPPSEIVFENSSTGDGLVSEWDFGNGFTQSSAGTGDVSQVYVNEGDYEVCLNVINDIGCQASQCETISIISAPTPQFSVSETSVCAGNYIIFTDDSSPTPTQLSWDFDGDGVEDATGSEVSHAYVTEGNFTPVLTAFYSDDCIGVTDQDITIEVLPAVQSDFSASESIACSVPLEVTFQDESTTPGIQSYEWLIDGVSIGSGTTIDYIFTEFGAYNVSLVTTTTLCADTLSVDDFILIQAPTIDFSLPAQICTDTEVPVDDVNIVSPDDVVDIEWDFDGDGVIDATGDDPYYAYNDPGVYTVQVFLSTVSGCTSTVSADQTIIVQPDVVAEFDASAQISCAGDAITFCADMVQNTTYAWNFGGSWINTAFPNECVSYTFQDTGYFDVTLSVHNTACNALITLEDYIYISPPVAEFDFQQDCANPNQVVFTDVSIEADELVWDFGDGSPLVYNELNPEHIFPAPGVYEVTLWAYNDETGCEDEYVATVVTTTDPVPLSATQNQGCAPVTPNFNSSANTQFVYWDIDFGNGVTATVELNPSNIWVVNVYYPDETVSYTNSFPVNWWPDVTYTQGGSYDVTITATDNSGCQITTVHEDLVTVYNDQFFAGFEAVIIDGCDDVIIEFQPTGNFLANGTWEFSDGTTSDELNPTHQFFPPWDYAFAATFTVTDDFGCNSEATDTLDLVPPPIPGFETSVDPSCIAQDITVSNTSTGDIVAYSWDFGNPGNPDNTSTEAEPVFSYLENGTYTICLTVENSQGCAQTLCQDNAVNIISPVAEIGFTPQINNCLFGVQFENLTEGELYCSDWSFGDGQFGSGTDPYHTYSIGVYDVELIVCNEFGCYDTTTVDDIFNLSNVIGPFSTQLDDFDCAPFQVEFEAYNSQDQGFSYFWDYGDGSGDPDNNTITNHSYAQPGTYCPSLVMQDQNGCTFLLECEEPIVVTEFTYELGDIEPVCFGESATFEVSGAENYTFSMPEIVSELGPNLYEVTAPESTTLEVTGYLSDCQQAQELEVVIYQLPEVTLDVPEGVCFGGTTFALTGGWPEGNTGVYSIDGVVGDTFDPSWTAGQSYEVSYAYTDENGCLNGDTSEVEIYTLPDVTLDPIPAMCELDELYTLDGGLPAGGTYSLDSNPVTDFDPSIGYGEYDITYNYVDNNGCAENSTVTVLVNASPNPAVTPLTFCWEETLTLTGEATIEEGSIASYEWDLGDYGLQSGSTATLNIDGPQTLTVNFNVSSDAGCFADTTLDIPVYPSPEALFSTEDFCEGEVINVVESSATDGEGMESWVWTINGEEFSTEQNPENYAPDVWGSFDVSLTVTNAEGCDDEHIETVYVSPLPVLDIDIDPACTGEVLTVTNNSEMPDGSTMSFVWNDSAGNASDNAVFNPSYTQHGTYTVDVIASSGDGCTSAETYSYEISPTPIPNFTWDDNFFCSMGSAQLTDASSIAEGSIVTWNWFVDGAAFDNGPETQFSSDTPGQFDIALEVVSDEGCTAQVNYPNLIEFWPVPSANFSYSPDEPDNATPYIFVTDQSEGATSVNYVFSDGSEYTIPDFQHEFGELGVYELMQVATNTYGCTDTLTVEIELRPFLNVFVPNAFTPDGDGINEVFKPVIAGLNVKDYRFIIVNRWGDLVFESDNPEEGWIGNVKGGEHYVPGGVYVWRLEVSTVETTFPEVFSGHVSILR